MLCKDKKRVKCAYKGRSFKSIIQPSRQGEARRDSGNAALRKASQGSFKGGLSAYGGEKGIEEQNIN